MWSGHAEDLLGRSSTRRGRRWNSRLRPPRSCRLSIPRPAIHLVTIPVTNTSVNPARSTGPALLAGGDYIGQLWLFWLAPIAGAVIAGLLTRWMYEQEAILDTIVVEERRVS
jgi:major intrinsic protein